MKNLLLVILLLSSIGAFAQVTHKIGVDLGVGASGGVFPGQSTSDVVRRPVLSFSGAFMYNLLLVEDRVNIGVGLGYENSGYTVDVTSFDTQLEAQSIILPLEFGYRGTGKTRFMADLLLVPHFLTVNKYTSSFTQDNGRDRETIVQGFEVLNSRINIKLGARVGIETQINDQLSFHVAGVFRVCVFDRFVGLGEDRIYNAFVQFGLKKTL